MRKIFISLIFLTLLVIRCSSQNSESEKSRQGTTFIPEKKGSEKNGLNMRKKWFFSGTTQDHSRTPCNKCTWSLFDRKVVLEKPFIFHQ